MISDRTREENRDQVSMKGGLARKTWNKHPVEGGGT